MSDKNLLLGFFLVSLPVGLKVIQMVFSKPDKRFTLSYNPRDMSVKGWFFAAILWIIWILAFYIMGKNKVF